jgi:hypothetical protein
MAYIDSWTSPSAPVIIPVHWIDSQYYNDTPPTAGTAVGVVLNSPNDPAEDRAKGFAPLTEMPELAKVLHWVTGVLGQHYSTSSTIPVAASTEATYNVKTGAFISNLATSGGWLSRPARGLTELHTSLTDVELAVQVLTAQLSSYTVQASKTPRLLASMYVTPSGFAVPWEEYTFSVVTDPVHTPGSTQSLAPSLGLPSSSANISYVFTPLPQSYDPFIRETRRARLDLAVQSGSYGLTAVTIIPHAVVADQTHFEDEVVVPVVQQLYTPNPTIFPTAQLTIEFEVSPFQSRPKRPFTVYIYGRNV